MSVLLESFFRTNAAAWCYPARAASKGEPGAAEARTLCRFQRSIFRRSGHLLWQRSGMQLLAIRCLACRACLSCSA